MLTITVINPDEVIFEGEAEYVLAPTARGMVGILPTHTPFFTELTPGEIIINAASETKIPLESGMLRVNADTVTILIGL